MGLGVNEWTRCRVHGQHLLAVCALCCGVRVWLAVLAAVVVVGVVWWVVCDLYSGCEHLVCSVVLFSCVGHSVDALASRADEGRCGLRYASGSWRASVIIRGCPNGGT